MTMMIDDDDERRRMKRRKYSNNEKNNSNEKKNKKKIVIKILGLCKKDARQQSEVINLVYLGIFCVEWNKF
ncbi:hypothetical protein Glove_251g33 [Diversispora epigaea]|uniref:Uncharacterized protein n=1 Tax=Diversispora epigaea TaxID=1348612 RepID=A0A397IDL6_9GLOM|nr:hypothetical protein Glove_251g33 [Diversispora epigaea]